MNILKALCVVVALLMVGCTRGSEAEPEPEPVSMIVTTALAACLKTNECTEPTEVQKVENETLYQITVKGGDATLLYFYTDRNRFGITFKVSAANQLFMEDRDLDGKVDKVSQIMEGVPGVKVYEPRSHMYIIAQRAYAHAMKIAEVSIIPEDLLDFMREEEELRKMEEEEKMKKYST